MFIVIAMGLNGEGTKPGPCIICLSYGPNHQILDSDVQTVKIGQIPNSAGQVSLTTAPLYQLWFFNVLM